MSYRDIKGIIKYSRPPYCSFIYLMLFRLKLQAMLIHNSLSLSCALRSFFHSGWPWLGFKGTACDWREGNIKESQL